MMNENIKNPENKNADERAGILDSINPWPSIRNIMSKIFQNRKSGADDGQQDLIYQGKEVDLRKIPVAREMFLKKKDTVLGKRFKKTLLGYTKGATSQYRGPQSTHVREYSDHYTIHRDFIDPRKNPISHLAKDAPMELAGWIIGGLIALVIIVLVIY